MTENYKILGKYIKDMSSETPNIETYIFVRDYISKYQLNIDINSKPLKNKMIEVNTILKFEDKQENKKKSYFEINYSTIVKINDEIKMLDDRLAQLKTLSATANPSWFHTMAAHSLLGTLVKGATLGTAGTVLGGHVAGVALPAGAYALGRGLASPTGQKIVAGQTAPQMATQRFLQADATGRTADILARSIGRTGMLTGGQQ